MVASIWLTMATAILIYLSQLQIGNPAVNTDLFFSLFFLISDFIPFSPNLVANLTPILSNFPPPCYLLRSAAYTSPPGGHS